MSAIRSSILHLRSSARLSLPVQLLDKPRLIQFGEEAHVDIGLWIGGGGLGIFRRHIIEHGFDAVRSWVGNFRKSIGIIFIRSLQSFWIRDAEVFFEKRFGIFLFGFDDMHRFNHGAGEFEHQRALCFDDALARKNAIPPKRNFEFADIVKIAEAELFRLGQEGFGYDRKLSYSL